MKIRAAEHQGEFDPSDPYDAMCESFRIQVAEMASQAHHATIYRDLSPERQLSSFMAGVLTGLIGVCFVQITDEGRDVLIEGILEAIPLARHQAEDVISNAISTHAIG